MDVSIVIINYNTLQLTRACIESVISYTKGLSYEIILVDNASTEEASILKEDYPSIHFIRSQVNLGFAGGNNLGITAATGKYILLLNSDTYLQQNALLITFNYLEKHSEAGVVSARLVYPDGRHQSAAQRLPSVRYLLIELFRIQKLLPKRSAGKLLLGAFFDNKENTTADWVWGTYFMFRREILKQLPEGKLDDRYFMYNEDMQWCIDIRKLGYQIHFCADAEVVHIMGGSAGKKNKMMEENGRLFMERNYSRLHRWLINILQPIVAR